MNLTVKNIPDAVYRAIKQEAREKKRSLNSQVILAMEVVAEEKKRRRALQKLRKEMESFAASLKPMDSSVPLIRADRDRR
jgi:hypothetical protein